LSTRIDLAQLLAEQRDRTDWRALARAITLVENSPAWEVQIPPSERHIHCIGVTGAPGAGKSTIVGRLIDAYTGGGARVAVLAVDPSSPISGGAVLGDRVRMEPYLGQEGVFVRSVASRGGHGALAASTLNIARVIEAAGVVDLLIVETVGAGQTEVAVASVADTVVLVTVPGLGDAVQVIKAGLAEVADLVVVNMADRPGTAETMRHFRLGLGREVPVLKTVATEGEGINELRAALDERWRALAGNGRVAARRRDRDVAEARRVAQEWIEQCALDPAALTGTSMAEAVGAVLKEAAARWHS
jgi:LAO/AO transport system kinase